MKLQRLLLTQLLGLLGLSAVLAGCSSYGQKFPTKPDYGLGSASVYEIQDLVQQGRLEEEVKYANDKKYRQHTDRNSRKTNNKTNMSHSQDNYDKNNEHLFNVLAKDEEIIEITILPYTDNNGDVHLQQKIYSRLDNVK